MSFMQHLNDVQSEEIMNEFKRFFHFLMPEDRDIFLKKLIQAVEEVKKEQELQNQSPQNEQTQTNENIEKEQSELKNPQEQIQNLAQSKESKEHLQDIPNAELDKEMERSESMPIEKVENLLAFDEKIQNALSEFTLKHQNELLEMGILKNDEQQEGVSIYNNDFLLDKEELKALKFDYDNASNKAEWQPKTGFDIEKIRQKHHNSQNFIDSFMKEVKEELGHTPSMEQDKKLNPNTYFTDLVDWFEKKKIENLDMPISKEAFKEEFFEYCKNGMGENEMKILLILQNKEPSILSKEHKDMIEQGLKYNLQNNKLLDKGLESAITASVGEKVSNENANEFVKTALKMKQSENTIDKRMSEEANKKIAQKIKENSPNLWQETNKKLNAIIENKTLSLEKSALSHQLGR
ncbi:hypothetical protein OQH61_03645 [Helicobacter sp. MIT 21-1697]|uniref:hypothetical protein n=1 Tax=Helicobacter sp. MIT 21-1697 TaxID=2993733 RepID=UPI00224B328C|nr:hypothetical protein [Helicobacter sp. MIT 21-1697]MCX2716828.1 hypothetical protein [Helicobacter sp. MIT 21-1697]